MKKFNLPQKIKTIIFDIDGTLYTSSEYLKCQSDLMIEYFAKFKDMSVPAFEKMISDYRTEWAHEHGGEVLSFSNVLVGLGISFDENIKCRDLLFVPDNYLRRDEKMIETFSLLKEKFSLICVTNNTVNIGRKTLEAIGVSHIVENMIGLDTFKVSKPAREPFEAAVKMTGAVPAECISVGDRYDIDIALPLEMGMGGILVDGAEDVYDLPHLLMG